MMAKPFLCTCPLCRRGLRLRIVDACRRERRWVGFWTIRIVAGLGWVPVEFYREVLDEALQMGLLIRMEGGDAPGDPGFPTYLASALAAPAPAARKRGGA